MGEEWILEAGVVGGREVCHERFCNEKLCREVHLLVNEEGALAG